MLRRLVIGCVIGSLGACTDTPSDPTSTRPTAAARQASTDKQALYGDPTLVPTREGERFRREIALAGEIEQALRLFPELDDVRVHAEVGPETTRVAVFVRTHPQVMATQIRAQVDAVVTAVAGADVLRSTTITATPPQPSEPRPELGLAMALALLGFGASLGVTTDRLARRRRRRRP